MNYPKEDILQALRVIKQTCKNQNCGGIVDCLSCPLSDGNTNCIVREQPPLDWDIKNEAGIWRAFKC